MGAQSVNHNQDREKRLKLSNAIVENVKNVPQEVSDFFFEKTMEDFHLVSKLKFDKEKMARQIYNAYMFGFAIGVEMQKKKTKK